MAIRDKLLGLPIGRCRATGGAPRAGWEAEAETAIRRLTFGPVDDNLLVVLGAGGVPSWLLEPLVLHGGKQVRQATARCPCTPVGALERLAGDGHPSVRLLVARHPAASPHALATLAIDGVWRVRRYAAQHPRLPSGALEMLASDGDRAVRYAVARRPWLSPALREQLGRDHDPAVRYLVAHYPALPTLSQRRIEREVASYDSPRVQPSAPGPTTPSDAADRGMEADAANIVGRRSARYADDERLLPALRTLARGRYDVLQRAVALAHPAIEPAVLEEAVGRADWIARYAVARNPRTPPQSLRILARDRERAVRLAARDSLATQDRS